MYSDTFQGGCHFKGTNRFSAFWLKQTIRPTSQWYPNSWAFDGRRKVIHSCGTGTIDSALCSCCVWPFDNVTFLFPLPLPRPLSIATTYTRLSTRLKPRERERDPLIWLQRNSLWLSLNQVLCVLLIVCSSCFEYLQRAARAYLLWLMLRC